MLTKLQYHNRRFHGILSAERIDNMPEMSPLGQYLLEFCDGLNLSMRQASIRAGLSPETIGMIVRRGKASRPRPETLGAIADNLGADFIGMMRLTGHLPPSPPDDIDPELRYKAEELLAIWRRLRDIDPKSAERLIRIALMQSEMVLAAANAGNREEREGEKERAGNTIASS